MHNAYACCSQYLGRHNAYVHTDTEKFYTSWSINVIQLSMVKCLLLAILSKVEAQALFHTLAGVENVCTLSFC